MNDFYKKKLRKRKFVTTAINAEKRREMENWWEQIFMDEWFVEEKWTSWPMMPITIIEIENAIKFLPNNKATGWDAIPNELLKYGG